MTTNIITLIPPTILAGVLTFLAPCTFPLVPGYLAFIGGSSIDAATIGARRRVFLNALAYTFGFSLVFIAFGSLAGLAGTVLAPYRLWLTRIGGLVVITFGFSMLGLFRLAALQRERRPRFKLVQPGRPLSSFLLGTAFAFGWTPCVGPILGSILLLASTATTVSQGAVLLTFFSLGLALPFLLVALGLGASQRLITTMTRYVEPISKIGGALLVALGFLLLSNQMNLLIAWGYQFFRFIHYDRLIQYL